MIIIALSGYPIGLLIAHLTKEELEEGKKWFRLIILTCVIAIIISVILAEKEVLFFLILSFVFILLIALASLVKSSSIKIKKIKKKKTKKKMIKKKGKKRKR